MHVNGGAYRKISVEEWRELGGDDNKFCDWHEGIGYVVYDAQALEQYRAKLASRSPLKWELNDEGQTFVKVPFGVYYIERNPTDRWCWGLSLNGESGVGLNPVENFEAAKASAQADYEQRALSALQHVAKGERG